MTPRTWAYNDVEGEDLPVRDRAYERYGQQGVGMPTYGPDPVRAAAAPWEPEDGDGYPRGATRVDLGEPIPRGPRGWQRRDEHLHDEVCARLTDDGHVDASEVDVVVHQGEVTLAGTVADRDQRDRALAVAASIRGVVDVVNHLHVGARRADGR